MTDLVEQIAKLNERIDRLSRPVRPAKVTAVDNPTATVSISFLDESAQVFSLVNRIASYRPTVNDIVLVLMNGADPIVIGPIAPTKNGFPYVNNVAGDVYIQRGSLTTGTIGTGQQGIAVSMPRSMVDASGFGSLWPNTSWNGVDVIAPWHHGSDTASLLYELLNNASQTFVAKWGAIGA